MIPTEDIQLRIPELPRRDPTLEQDIHLTVRATLRFRQAEEDPHDAKRTAPSPEERALRGPAPSIWFRSKLIRGKNIDDNTSDIVEVTCEHDGLGFQAGGRDFRDERVADRAHSEVVDESEDQKHGADGPAGGDVGFWGDGCEADDEEEGEQGAGPVEVEGSAAGAGHQEPGAHCADHAEGVLDHGEVEGGGGGESGLLVEVG